jgi:hypothetical protein
LRASGLWGRLSQAPGLVEIADDAVALSAEEPTDFTGVMVVIHHERLDLQIE